MTNKIQFNLKNKSCRDCERILTIENWNTNNIKINNYLCNICFINKRILNKIEKSVYDHQRSRNFKLKIIEWYGGKCIYCKEDKFEFLTIDHINNDGAEHRKKVSSGSKFYKWIIKNNYPKNLQLLCWNCNCTK